jgi:hypothetical protein
MKNQLALVLIIVGVSPAEGHPIMTTMYPILSEASIYPLLISFSLSKIFFSHHVLPAFINR